MNYIHLLNLFLILFISQSDCETSKDDHLCRTHETLCVKEIFKHMETSTKNISSLIGQVELDILAKHVPQYELLYYYNHEMNRHNSQQPSNKYHAKMLKAQFMNKVCASTYFCIY